MHRQSRPERLKLLTIKLIDVKIATRGVKLSVAASANGKYARSSKSVSRVIGRQPLSIKSDQIPVSTKPKIPIEIFDHSSIVSSETFRGCVGVKGLSVKLD